jgi:hypothetical protein
MHLIYLDESGNSGTNLADPQQPIFVLGALIVAEHRWKAIEQAVVRQIDTFFEGNVPQDYEIHASEIRGGRGIYKGMDLKKRIAYRDALMQIPVDFGLPFIYRAITKKRFSGWLERTFGKGIFINPHIAAYPLVSQTINTYLRDQGEDTLGILINDENKEVVADIERTTKLLRADPSHLQLDRIIEKTFFIDSRKSPLLQLADLCAFHARKLEESKIGLPDKPVDRGGIERLDPLIHRGNESMPDVLAWLTAQKRRSGEDPGGAGSSGDGLSRR